MGFLRRVLGKRSDGDESDYDRLVAQSIEELKLETSAHDALRRIGEADWNVTRTRASSEEE